MRRLVIILFAIALLFFALTLFEWRPLYFGIAMVAALALLGLHDLLQSKHAILRNFPIIGHFRYMLEFIRPEIQQYFITDNQNGRPFNRETRSLIYQRAKGLRDTMPFGTQKDIHVPGFESIRHSLNPTTISEKESRVIIGGEECKQPYSASRLNISAMSFGAISKNAVLALNQGAKIGNFAHNTGEGGLSPYHLEGGGDIIWQIGTGNFGCRKPNGDFDANLFQQKATHDHVKMIEIKLSQGAKPSHGGILPAIKITKEISEIRNVSMGEDCLSPPTHPSFSTPEGLLQHVATLRELSGGKPVGFKLAIGKRSQFLGICKAMVKTKILPDFITVDGAEGGTGAAPVEFSNYLAEPVNEALLFVHHALVGVNLREKITVIASGKVASGFDMVTKIALGANCCNSARGMMFALGCIQSLQCNANTCPTGVTTQNQILVRGLVVKDKCQRVANFHKATIHSCLELAGAMGIEHLDDLSPADIFQRTNFAYAKCYEDLYEAMNPGDLLEGNIPEPFTKPWANASAESF